MVPRNILAKTYTAPSFPCHFHLCHLLFFTPSKYNAIFLEGGRGDLFSSFDGLFAQIEGGDKFWFDGFGKMRNWAGGKDRFRPKKKRPFARRVFFCERMTD